MKALCFIKITVITTRRISDFNTPTLLSNSKVFVITSIDIINRKVIPSFFKNIEARVPKYLISISLPLPPQHPKSKNIGAITAKNVIINE